MCKYHDGVCEDLHQQARGDPSFKLRIKTDYESFFYSYHPDAKLQWKSQQSWRPKRVHQVRSETFSSSFLDINGIVPQGQSVKAECYYNIPQRLRENSHRKGSELWPAYNWNLQHDNMPAESRALDVCDVLSHDDTVIIPQPPCSPILAPRDFFLFLKMKFGPRFVAVEPSFRSLVKSQIPCTNGHKNACKSGGDDDQAMNT